MNLFQTSYFGSTANFLFVGVALFWGGEATFNLYAARSYIFSQNKTHNAKEFLDNDENYFQILEKNNYNPNDFSCVLSLPFSSQGSEKLSRVNEESFYQSFKASYNLKLRKLSLGFRVPKARTLSSCFLKSLRY